MILRTPPDNPLYDLVLLTLAFALLFGFSLGDRPYSAPSESRYIEVGREMAESGDFVTPRLNYVKYFEKPPLFYWIQAEATRLWGIDSFRARVPTALCAVLLCLVTYGLGHTLYGRGAGLLGSLTLATTLYVFALSRIVLLDVPVSLFIVTTLATFLYSAHAPQSTGRTLVLYGMYIAAACAVLTKGLIGAVLPGIVIFLWLALTRRWKLLGNIRLASGILLFLLIAVPWHVLVSLRNPEFLHFYFIHEHWERYTSRVHGRYEPDWFFLVVLLGGLFPWVTFAWQGLKTGLSGFWQERMQDGKPLFLALWIGVIFVFFSLSDSKLIPYILPVFPPVAVLLGRYLAQAWQEKPAPGFKMGVWAMILLLLLMAIVPNMLSQLLDADNKVAMAIAQGGDEARNLSIAAIIAAGLLLVTYIQGRACHVITAMLIVCAAIMQMGDAVSAHYNRNSMQTLAGIIQSMQQKNDEVVSYAAYYQDLPVYLNRRITVVDWKGELEFGMEHENTSSWMMDDKSFWPRWLKGDHLMFMVMHDETFERLTRDKKPETLHLNLIKEDGGNLLIINRSPETLQKAAH